MWKLKPDMHLSCIFIQTNEVILLVFRVACHSNAPIQQESYWKMQIDTNTEQKKKKKKKTETVTITIVWKQGSEVFTNGYSDGTGTQ